MWRFNFNRALGKGRLNEFNDPFTPKYTARDRENIVKITASDPYRCQCMVKVIDGKVLANAEFLPGDVVEICPCKVVNQTWIDDVVKGIAFEIEGGKYAIPFGYVQWYMLSDAGNLPNCDYMFDPNANVIVVKATGRVKKDEPLVIDSGCGEGTPDENGTGT